jgi:hypothetical protein
VRKQLHILEHPILHGKPADDLPVHVVWEPEEYAFWNKEPDGALAIWQGDGNYTHNGAGELVETRKVVYILRPGAYLKAWQEDVPDLEPQVERTAEVEPINAEPDFVIERAQPGHDGFSEDPKVITGEHVIVTRVDEYTEPLDQQTQVIPHIGEGQSDKSKRPEYLIDIQGGTPVRKMREEPKKLDWGTLTQPLVVPETITFFDGDEGKTNEE